VAPAHLFAIKAEAPEQPKGSPCQVKLGGRPNWQAIHSRQDSLSDRCPSFSLVHWKPTGTQKETINPDLPHPEPISGLGKLSIAVSYKESRRIWYRDLLSTLDVDDPDTLATQLSLPVDGAYAAALIRKDPHTMQSAIAAPRTLLKAAGAQLSVGGAA
jgi:hypothetical protein